MKAITEHEKRIKQELIAAGVTNFGLKKFAIKYLPKVIHENEHIKGIVYGRYGIEGGPSLNEGTLIATDLRIIFLDHKPGYTKKDIITYDVVSGVKITTAIFSAVTLHTRLGDFVIRFANSNCANRFKKYIESHRIENIDSYQALTVDTSSPIPGVPSAILSAEASNFLHSHELATFSTVDKSENVDGAAVYYYPSPEGYIYILTKAETKKAHNIFTHAQVALTIYDELTLRTLQLQGLASVETDPLHKQYIFDHIVKPRQYGDKKRLPPVTQLDKGAFMIIKITPTNFKYRDYKNDKTI